MDEKRAQTTDIWIAELQEEAEKHSRAVGAELKKLHKLAGDMLSYSSRRDPYWQLTDTEVVASITEIEETGKTTNPSCRWHSITDAVLHLASLRFAEERLAALNERQWLLESIWQAERWSRFYVVTSSDNGHIHSSVNCSTCYPTTTYGWDPSLSGKDEAAAVAAKGPYLCSVCFPSAPVEWRRDRSDDLKAERAAARAEREAAKAVKNLRPAGSDGPGEQFRDANNWLITTVAGAVKVLRDEVEARYWYARAYAEGHYTTAARKAAEVLLAREERQPGTGKTQEQIDEIIARAEKKNKSLAQKRASGR